MYSNLLPLVFALSAIYGFYQIALYLYDRYTSPIRNLPGPPSSSLLLGNIPDIAKADPAAMHIEWEEKYGHVFLFTGLFGKRRLYTTDLKALNHMLMDTNLYHKPSMSRYALEALLGPGVVVMEGDKHKQQRKIMNPAFGPAQIRDLTEIFIEKALKLRDIWSSRLDGGSATIDVLHWLSKMTLDVIGKAGFNYEFDSLNVDKPPNELNEVFSFLFRTEGGIPIIPLLQAHIPALRFIPTRRTKETARARSIMDRIGKQLLRESKAAAQEMKESKQRDLLTLLVQSNLQEQGTGLSDDDVLAQIPTFFTAGHETTSTGTTWALYALSQNLAAQSKLRDEALTLPTDNPTMDELNALPYLDMVIREALRLYCPVPSVTRQAMADDFIPLNNPFVDKNGVTHDSIHVRKGQVVFISLISINTSKALWGEDAKEFKPERWENVPEAVNSIPGILGGMLTFLGGPRACIGYRFALVEMKALLFTLVRAFEFELAVPAKDVGRRSTAVVRPIVIGDGDKNQMPMVVKPFVVD